MNSMINTEKITIDLQTGKQFQYDYILQNRVIKVYQDNARITIAVDKSVPVSLKNELIHHFRDFTLDYITITQKQFNELTRSISGSSDTGTTRHDRGTSKEDLSKLASDAPIVNLVNQIILEAVDRQASDIHFEAYDDYFMVRFRVTGFLQVHGTFQKHLFEAVSARIKFLSKLDITQRFLAQDGKALLHIADQKLDIRTSTMPTIWGESIVLRLLGVNQNLNDLGSLGMDDHTIETLKTITTRSNGAFILTGPTGSGKTTTLRALLNLVDISSLKVLTIEDPVEYTIDRITQMQVNDRIGFGFDTILRNMLRQDPNVIMVGEMRDLQTADLALRSAMTGHLVLSTLHTNDSIASITRLINMGIEPYVLESSLVAAAAQRLVRTLCPGCRKEIALPTRDRNLFTKYGIEQDSIFTAAGCEICDNTGFSGRTAVFELFQVDDKVRGMIIERKPLETIREYLLSRGFVPMIKKGLQGVVDGRFDLPEVKSIIGEVR
jgi:type IV pilus assembly protein PilB